MVTKNLISTQEFELLDL